MKKAFTLIELLVVIAIIAILAAILFPVFAQAKAAAKQAAALSNTKQQSLGVLMYQGDYDDGFPLGTVWNTGNDELCFGGAGCLSTWAWVTAPYVKSAPLYNDPTAVAMTDIFKWGQPVAFTYMPEFGYNYTWLGYWAPTGPGGATVPTWTNGSQSDQPANTVMLGSKWTHYDQSNYTANNFWFSTIPGQAEDSALESIDCGNITQWCFTDWGSGGQFDTGGVINSGGIPITEGRYTAGVADRVSNHMTVAWVDGHSSKVTPGALSAGTNFNPNAKPGQPGGNGAITIIHAQQYPWMLTHDCTLDPGAGCQL